MVVASPGPTEGSLWSRGCSKVTMYFSANCFEPLTSIASAFVTPSSPSSDCAIDDFPALADDALALSPPEDELEELPAFPPQATSAKQGYVWSNSHQNKNSEATIEPADNVPSADKPKGMRSISRWAIYVTSMFFVLMYANRQMMLPNPWMSRICTRDP